MDSFIAYVSKHLFTKFGKGISDLCLVFPSRRAALFFRQALSEQLREPLWMPESLTMNDWIMKAAGRKADDELLLLSHLYNLYSGMPGAVRKSFDEFYYMGKSILYDFDLIDKYLVNARDLYANLADIKRIDSGQAYLSEQQIACIQSFWSSFSPRADENSLQKKFLSIWDMLLPLYEGFQKLMEEKGIAYPGAIYRKVAGEEGLDAFRDSLYVFIGFNALNPCEKAILMKLKQAGRALFYWDYDRSFLMDDEPAGTFIRENLAAFGQADPGYFPDNFVKPKQIEVISVPAYTTQAKILPRVLTVNGMPLDRRTAVVLADEGLLSPLLFALSDTDETGSRCFNVTMGYPLKNSLCYGLVKDLCRLYANARTVAGQLVRGFYYKDVMTLLLHPFLVALQSEQITRVVDKIKNDHILYLNPESLPAGSLLQSVFSLPGNPEAFFSHVHALLRAVETSAKAMGAIEATALLYVSEALIGIKLSVRNLAVSMSLPFVMNLLLKSLSSIDIPFSGEPLEGLQIMGMLETRCLDFENLVILSAQEEFLPKAYRDTSLIPYHLKQAFNMPSIEQHEALYAYYFYRLIARAGHIVMTYSTKALNAVTPSEKSRFIRQLDERPEHAIVFSALSCTLLLPQKKPIVVTKDARVLLPLNRFLADAPEGRFLSPTAINDYIKCPLRFYFSQVRGLGETEEMAEDIDGQSFGLVLHTVLQKLYSPFAGKEMKASFYDDIRKNPGKLTRLIRQAVNTQFGISGTDDCNWSGQWVLMASMIRKYIQKMLDFDAANLPFKILELERSFSQPLTVRTPQNTFTLRIGGKIDRVIEKRGRIIIGDYKTGADRSRFRSLDALFASRFSEQNGAVLQIMLYAFIYARSHRMAGIPLPHLYFIRRLFTDSATGPLTDGERNAEIVDLAPYEKDFWENIQSVLSQIFNFDLPFEQTQDTDACTYCSYKTICQK